MGRQDKFSLSVNILSFNETDTEGSSFLSPGGLRAQLQVRIKKWGRGINVNGTEGPELGPEERVETVLTSDPELSQKSKFL